jgi:sugar-specific transcriptional regulator TrmB
MKNITKILQEYGFSNKQAKTYLAMLSLGIASITRISKKAGLKRPTTYLIIDELLDKQFIISIPQGKRTYYKAENPENLIKKLEERKNKVEAILPQLNSLYIEKSKQPKVRFYEGKKQIYKIYEEIFKSKEIWAMFSVERLSKIFSHEENEHFFRILIRQGGIIYDMTEDTAKARAYVRTGYRQGVSEVRFLPRDFQIAVDILVSENKTVMISFDNLIGIIIEDENIAEAQKSNLQFIWNHIT